MPPPAEITAWASAAMGDAIGDAVWQTLLRVFGMMLNVVVPVLGKKSASGDREDDPGSEFVPELLAPFFSNAEGFNCTRVRSISACLLRIYFGLCGLLDPLLAGPESDGRQNKPTGKTEICEKPAGTHLKNPPELG